MAPYSEISVYVAQSLIPRRVHVKIRSMLRIQQQMRGNCVSAGAKPKGMK